MGADDQGALLAAHSPVLRYDSQGSFAADSPAIVAERGGRKPNALVGADGTPIAVAGARDGGLNLGYLGATYPGGRRAKKDDYLDEVGRDYVAQARAMHVDSHRDRVYGHAVEASDDLWLQYWLFYYYNDKAFLGFGLHEGDWEMVQVRLDSGRVPREMTFAQHAHGQRCSWDSVETHGTHPIVYVARGSQASYPTAGTHDAPVVKDRADGQGPEVEPTLEVITDRSPGWVAWPGRWGSTRARNRLESSSPRGPRFHAQWKDPAAFHADAREVNPERARAAGGAGLQFAAPPAPAVRATRESEQRVVVKYDVPRAATDTAPTALVVSIDARGDGLPPITHQFPIDSLSGEVTVPAPLDAARSYVVRASTADDEGTSSATVDAVLRRPRGG